MESLSCPHTYENAISTCIGTITNTMALLWPLTPDDCKRHLLVSRTLTYMGFKLPCLPVKCIQVECVHLQYFCRAYAGEKMSSRVGNNITYQHNFNGNQKEVTTHQELATVLLHTSYNIWICDCIRPLKWSIIYLYLPFRRTSDNTHSITAISSILTR